MRSITASADVLLGNQFAMVVLIRMALTQDVFIATGRDDIDWGGNTYLGGTAAGIEQIRDQTGEVVGLSFALSGVPVEMIAIAMAEPIRGKLATVSLALMRPEDEAIMDVLLLWTGNLDQMPIIESNETATINVTAEHRGMYFARPKGLMYSDADQQRLYPGDRCLEFLTAQSAHQDIWPAASWGRQ
jgi:hypothetical protein